MWRFLTFVFLSNFFLEISHADTRLFAVPKVLRIGMADQSSIYFNWTFARPHSLFMEGTPIITVHVEWEGRTKTYTVPVSESFRSVGLFEASDDFAAQLSSDFTWLEGVKYISSFRTLTKHGGSSPITRMVLKQKIPARYEVSCDSSQPESVQKCVVEQCSFECFSSEIAAGETSSVFFIPIHYDFSVSVKAVYDDPRMRRYKRSTDEECDLDPSERPREITVIKRAEQIEDQVHIEWEPAEKTDPPITYYELYLTNANETTPGITFVVYKPKLKAYAPVLLGTHYLVKLRAVKIGDDGKKCSSEYNEIQIPKYVPRAPLRITLLKRKPRFVVFSVVPANPETQKRFKVSIVSPPNMGERFIARKGAILKLKPYTRVIFDVRQCYVLWESHDDVCGPPLRAEIRSNVARPSPVRVHELVSRSGRSYVEWDEPEEPNGPIAGYEVIINGKSEMGYFVVYGFLLEPSERSFPYDHKEIASPHSYTVIAYTVDIDSGKHLRSKKVWITPLHTFAKKFVLIASVTLGVLALIMIAIFI